MDIFSAFEERTEGPGDDRFEGQAIDGLREFFNANQNKVFYSRQVQVRFENLWFHWVTHRALKALSDEGLINAEMGTLDSGAPILLLWHRRCRYYTREAGRIIDLVNEFSAPQVTEAIGRQGEAMVQDGFVSQGFRRVGRNVNQFEGRAWTVTNHNLDFIFERDGIAHGVEVKNTLPYIEREELLLKTEMCLSLGIKPVFAVRWMPKSWIEEVRMLGGFSLLFGKQLYPWGLGDLAGRVAARLELPVECPSSLPDGVMARFMRHWHEKFM